MQFRAAALVLPGGRSPSSWGGLGWDLLDEELGLQHEKLVVSGRALTEAWGSDPTRRRLPLVWAAPDQGVAAPAPQGRRCVHVEARWPTDTHKSSGSRCGSGRPKVFKTISAARRGIQRFVLDGTDGSPFTEVRKTNN